jgi:hypothetical protein
MASDRLPSSHSAKPVELRTEGAIFEAVTDLYELRPGLQLVDDTRVAGVLPRTRQCSDAV